MLIFRVLRKSRERMNERYRLSENRCDRANF